MSNKELYGEIFTPISLIDQMCHLLPEHVWTDPSLTWLDPGCGPGLFSIQIYLRLFRSKGCLNAKHIINNMLHMVELNPKHIPLVYDIFKTPNLYEGDYLSWNPDKQFDIIIGNPPFNHRGLIKTPTSKLEKGKDGKAVWRDFIRKSLRLLTSGGYLCFIVPSIWMKPDREGIYDLLTSYKIHKIHCFNNTQTNKLFRGEAQTPTCFFLLQKIPTDHTTLLWDTCLEKYIPYSLQLPIPVFGSGIIAKFLKKLTPSSRFHIIKTSMPSTKITLKDDASLPYKNIHTCRLNGITPTLIYTYSDLPCPHYGKNKLVMAHGMYGFPYLDISGEYGISNRDKYVIVREKEEDLKKLAAFFSTKTALYLFEATRYRMKYLEKYIFELIPDISTLEDFPPEINDDTIATYFSLDASEKYAIQQLHQREYNITEG